MASAPMVFATMLRTSENSGYFRLSRKYFWRPLTSERNKPSRSKQRNSLDTRKNRREG